MFSTNVIMEQGFRWALIGAAVGGVGGVLNGFSKRSLRNVSATPQAGPTMELDLQNLVDRMDVFRSHCPQSYNDLTAHARELSQCSVESVSHAKPPFSTAKKASSACSNMIESVRELRAKIMDTKPAVQTIEEYDEIAGTIQKTCNDYMHNITLTIQSKR